MFIYIYIYYIYYININILKKYIQKIFLLTKNNSRSLNPSNVRLKTRKTRRLRANIRSLCPPEKRSMVLNGKPSTEAGRMIESQILMVSPPNLGCCRFFMSPFTLFHMLLFHDLWPKIWSNHQTKRYNNFKDQNLKDDSIIKQTSFQQRLATSLPILRTVPP